MNPLLKNIEKQDCKAVWKAALTSPLYLSVFACIMLVGSVLMYNLPHFLLYKETVAGTLLYDPITSNFPPIDFNPYIFYITTIFIVIGKVTSILTPRGLLHMTAALGLLNILRVAVLYMVNLDAPLDIIPLYDPLLECTFYKDVLITKDLFFSGHTSNIIVFAFLTQVRFMKYIFICSAVIVGSMLVLQHVHYTIDVIAAPFFAYGAFRITDVLLGILEQRFFKREL